jgi:hypothetical protein
MAHGRCLQLPQYDLRRAEALRRLGHKCNADAGADQCQDGMRLADVLDRPRRDPGHSQRSHHEVMQVAAIQGRVGDQREALQRGDLHLRFRRQRMAAGQGDHQLLTMHTDSADTGQGGRGAQQAQIQLPDAQCLDLLVRDLFP